MRFCLEHGIDEEICDFANRLVDMPEEYIPKLLRNAKVREYISRRLNLSPEEIDTIVRDTEITYKIKNGKICEDCNFRNECKFKDLEKKPKVVSLGENIDLILRCNQLVLKYRRLGYRDNQKIDLVSKKSEITISDFVKYKENCPIHKNYSNAITHGRVHKYHGNSLCLHIVKEIARYFYGEEGVKAVELHLELDEISHVLNDIKSRIPSYLARGVRGKVIDNFKEYTLVNFIRKYIYRDPFYLVRKMDRANYRTFLDNISRLLLMTAGEFLSEYGHNYSGFLKNKYIIEILTENEEKFGQFLRFLKKNVEILERIADNELLRLLK